MDIISHALWTNLIFKELPVEQRSLAIFFGTMPDIISFSRATVRKFIKRTFPINENGYPSFPKFSHKLYNITHSLVIWGGVFMFLLIFNFLYIAYTFLAWGLHILFDIFTHKRNYFPTPILWPLSNFKFSGISWRDKKFMLLNYVVLIFLYLIFYF